MKRTSILTALLVLLCLALTPVSAQALNPANFGIADAEGPALPGPSSFWAGACDLTSTAVDAGAPPAPNTARQCIDWGRPQFGNPVWFVPPAWRLAAEARAGAHPEGTATFMFRRTGPGTQTGPQTPAVDGNADNIYVELPPGFVGDPNATPKCTPQQFESNPPQCPPQTQVGVSEIALDETFTFANLLLPVYNLVPRQGRTAEFGIPQIVNYTSVRIVGRARTDGDFGITTLAENIPAPLPLMGQSITLWGVPWAAAHDKYRVRAGFNAGGISPPLVALSSSDARFGIPPEGLTGADPCPTCGVTFPASNYEPQRYSPAWGTVKPFISNPTECTGASLTTTLRTNSFQEPEAMKSYVAEAPPITNCDKPPFDPAIALDPVLPGKAANQATDTPSGLDVELTIPQNDDLPFSPPPNGAPQLDVDSYVANAGAYWSSDQGLATSHLEDTVVTLPPGMTLNPAAADGQGACTMGQIGVTDTGSPVPPRIRFDNDPVACPDSSKVGEVTVETPLLEEADWPTGSVYLAKQGDNPFGSDFAIYIAVESPERGLIAKLAGKVDPDPATGRLTTSFLENPQLPFERFRLSFRAGPRAALATPVTCGTHTSVNSFTPYSDPGNPVVVQDSFDLSSSPAGGCPSDPAQRPLSLGFAAGSTEVVAGAHSPFTARFTRGDGNQELDRIELTTPEGLAAKLAGVPYCPEAGIAQAISRTATGDGAKELASPSCPASSRVGTTTIGAGAGAAPFFVKGGVYLAGPYKGAPISLAFIVPAVAGPFDLGVQVVRTALQINPKTAQVTAVSDTIPKILRGVPLRLRDIRVDVDRPGFILNPTDCSEQQVTGTIYGANGAVAKVSNRFQIAECATLGFKPNLKLQLFGGTKRGAYQRLKATLTARPGDANIARAAVTLPHSEFLAQEHIRTVCTRVQFAADQCPAGSIYGKATAISPLLDQPLTGPVYLRSSDNTLPDLVAALRGPDNQPIEIELSGRTDSKNEGIRNTFDVVPDAPVSKFTLEMMGGKKSLIVNSTSICKGVHKAEVKMDGQNGRKHSFTPKVTNPACAKAKKGKKSKAQKRTVAQRSLANIARELF